MLAPTMSVLAAGRLLRVRSRRRWRVFDHQVRQERAGERHAGVRAIDVDDAGGKSNASGFLLAAGAEAQVPGDEPVVQETFGRLVGERQVGVVQWLHDCGVVLEDLTAELAEIGESLPVGSEAFYRWQGMVHRQARSFHVFDGSVDRRDETFHLFHGAFYQRDATFHVFDGMIGRRHGPLVLRHRLICPWYGRRRPATTGMVATGQRACFTGRGFGALRRGLVASPVPGVLLAVSQQVAVQLLDVVLGQGNLLLRGEHPLHDFGVAGYLLLIAGRKRLHLQPGQQAFDVTVRKPAAFEAGG
mgnify:CR=1 FL=1